MNLIDRAVLAISPQAGLSRLRARKAARVLMSYDAATGTRRGKSWRTLNPDADAAAARRDRLTAIARDMARNTPLAARARDVIVNNVVGDGIIPSVEGASEAAQAAFLAAVRQHFDTTDVDAHGRQNLYGLQRLAFASVVESGECLIRIRTRRESDGLALPFQLELLEPDFLDTTLDTFGSSGPQIHEGIEYDAIGRRVAYHLYREHPGSRRTFRPFESRRVAADQIIHLYRQDRPGQMRGVSWFAPVAMTLQDLRDYSDAQIMRQKVAACFAGFRLTPDTAGDDVSTSPIPATLAPGFFATLGPGDDVKFAAPPGVDGHDEFMKTTIREVAAGMGITYEALSGDLSTVNFSSARMGRLEMNRNVSQWQWLMMIPQMLNRIGDLVMGTWVLTQRTPMTRGAVVRWTPPAQMIVDPAKEIPAMRDQIRAGLMSWSEGIRRLGYDPETVADQIAGDRDLFDEMGLVVESDPRRPKNGGVAPTQSQEERTEDE